MDRIRIPISTVHEAKLAHVPRGRYAFRNAALDGPGEAQLALFFRLSLPELSARPRGPFANIPESPQMFAIGSAPAPFSRSGQDGTREEWAKGGRGGTGGWLVRCSLSEQHRQRLQLL